MAMGKLIEFVSKNKKKRTPVASKALKKVIRKEIAGVSEIKQVDASFSGTTSSAIALATGGTTTLSDIVEGTSELQRVGDQIWVKSLNLRGIFRSDDMMDNDVYCYLAVVLYKRCDGRNPDIAEIWTGSNMGISLRHADFLTEYSVLKMIKVKLLPRYGAAAASAPIQDFRWNHRFKGRGMKVQYDGVSGAATDVITNNIFVYIQYAGEAPPTQPALINCVMRINYTD